MLSREIELRFRHRTQSDFESTTINYVYGISAEQKLTVVPNLNASVGGVHLPVQELAPNVKCRFSCTFVSLANVSDEASLVLRQKPDSQVGYGGFAWRHGLILQRQPLARQLLAINCLGGI